MATLRSAIAYGARALSEVKIQSSAIEARILLQHAAGCSLEELLKFSGEQIEPDVFKYFDTLIARRAKFEPIAYITGRKEFYGLDFKVTPSVLIPRNDSEVLIDAVLGRLDGNKNIKILDIGTGSGCLIIALMKHLPNAAGWALDISGNALEVAKENALAILEDERITFLQSDCFANLSQRQFDIIISNPPYIATEERGLMSPETQYEPSSALFAKESGLAIYQQIAQTAANYMKSNAMIYLEVGFRQSAEVEKIFTKSGFVLEEAYLDIQNHTRCICLKLDH